MGIRLIINNIKTHSDIIENAKKGDIQEIQENNEIENLFQVICFLLKASTNSLSKTDLIIKQFKVLNEIAKVTTTKEQNVISHSRVKTEFECGEYDSDDYENLKEEIDTTEEDNQDDTANDNVWEPHEDENDIEKVTEENVTISI